MCNRIELPSTNSRRLRYWFALLFLLIISMGGSTIYYIAVGYSESDSSEAGSKVVSESQVVEIDLEDRPSIGDAIEVKVFNGTKVSTLRKHSNRYCLVLDSVHLVRELRALSWRESESAIMSKGYARISLSGRSDFDYYLNVSPPMTPSLDSINIKFMRFNVHGPRRGSIAVPSAKDVECMRVAVSKLAWELSQSKYLLNANDVDIKGSYLDAVYCLQATGRMLGLSWKPWIQFTESQMDLLNANRIRNGFAAVPTVAAEAAVPAVPAQETVKPPEDLVEPQ